jgi:hypothetical protein
LPVKDVENTVKDLHPRMIGAQGSFLNTGLGSPT